jgi:hypothetical protein
MTDTLHLTTAQFTALRAADESWRRAAAALDAHTAQERELKARVAEAGAVKRLIEQLVYEQLGLADDVVAQLTPTGDLIIVPPPPNTAQ